MPSMTTLERLRRAIAGGSIVLALAALALAVALWWSLAPDDTPEAPPAQPPNVKTVVTNP
jgi:hypothetical protein